MHSFPFACVSCWTSSIPTYRLNDGILDLSGAVLLHPGLPDNDSSSLLRCLKVEKCHWLKREEQRCTGGPLPPPSGRGQKVLQCMSSFIWSLDSNCCNFSLSSIWNSPEPRAPFIFSQTTCLIMIQINLNLMWELNHEFCFLMRRKMTLTKKSQSSTWKATSFTASPCLIRCCPISEGRGQRIQTLSEPKPQLRPRHSNVEDEGTYLHSQDLVAMQRQTVSERRGEWWRISDRWTRVFIWSKQQEWVSTLSCLMTWDTTSRLPVSNPL